MIVWRRFIRRSKKETKERKKGEKKIGKKWKEDGEI
jgi:hypothetical protein